MGCKKGLSEPEMLLLSTVTLPLLLVLLSKHLLPLLLLLLLTVTGKSQRNYWGYKLLLPLLLSFLYKYKIKRI